MTGGCGGSYPHTPILGLFKLIADAKNLITETLNFTVKISTKGHAYILIKFQPNSWRVSKVMNFCYFRSFMWSYIGWRAMRSTAKKGGFKSGE